METLEQREVTPPPVCVLCWDYILEGEQTVRLVEGLAHAHCWRVGEAAA